MRVNSPLLTGIVSSSTRGISPIGLPASPRVGDRIASNPRVIVPRTRGTIAVGPRVCDRDPAATSNPTSGFQQRGNLSRLLRAIDPIHPRINTDQTAPIH